MKPLSPDLRRRIVAAIDGGETHLEVAERFDVSPSTVARILQRFRRDDTLDPRPHAGGRTPIFGTEERERLRCLVDENNDATLARLRELGGWACSIVTLWRVLRDMKITLKVKTKHADEAESPEALERRANYGRSARRYGADRLVFLDETGVNTTMTPTRARAPRGERAVGSAPLNRKSKTVVAAIGLEDGVMAPLAFDGAMNAETFEGYFEHVLMPELRPEHVVVMDNLSAHKEGWVLDTIRRTGAKVLFLPPYAPDLNPIEKMWSKVKEFMKHAKARTSDAVVAALGEALRTITGADLSGWYKAAGLPPIRV